MDNKHRKLFAIKQSKGCKSLPKCTKIRLAAGHRRDPMGGELMRSPDSVAAMGPTSNGRGEEEGLFVRWAEGRRERVP